jgi:hypothetical protein
MDMYQLDVLIQLTKIADRLAELTVEARRIADATTAGKGELLKAIDDVAACVCDLQQGMS